MTEAELREELQDKTLADIAKEQGKTAAGLVQQLVATQTKRIDEAVADGKLSEEQAAELKADLAERMGLSSRARFADTATNGTHGSGRVGSATQRHQPSADRPPRRRSVLPASGSGVEPSPDPRPEDHSLDRGASLVRERYLVRGIASLERVNTRRGGERGRGSRALVPRTSARYNRPPPVGQPPPPRPFPQITNPHARIRDREDP